MLSCVTGNCSHAIFVPPTPSHPPGCVPAGEQEQDDPCVDRGGGGNGHQHLACVYVEEDEIRGMDWFGFNAGSCGKER